MIDDGLYPDYTNPHTKPLDTAAFALANCCLALSGAADEVDCLTDELDSQELIIEGLCDELDEADDLLLAEHERRLDAECTIADLQHQLATIRTDIAAAVYDWMVGTTKFSTMIEKMVRFCG